MAQDRKEYMKKYHAEHREQIRASKEKYREAHRDEIREYDRVWRKKHPDQVRSYRKTKGGSDETGGTEKI